MKISRSMTTKMQLYLQMDLQVAWNLLLDSVHYVESRRIRTEGASLGPMLTKVLVTTFTGICRCMQCGITAYSTTYCPTLDSQKLGYISNLIMISFYGKMTSAPIQLKDNHWPRVNWLGWCELFQLVANLVTLLVGWQADFVRCILLVHV